MASSSSAASVDDAPLSDLDRLCDFCGRGHKEAVKEFITKDRTLIRAKGNLDWTPLHFASNGGHLDIVELLLHSGADANAQNKNGDSPLHLAAWKDHPKVVQLLLAWKGNKNLTNKDGKSPAQLARGPETKALLPEVSQEELGNLVKLAPENDDDDDW